MKPPGWTRIILKLNLSYKHLAQLFSSWQNQQQPAVHLNNWRSFFSSVLMLKADWQLQDFSVQILLFLQVSIGFCIAICQFKQSSLSCSALFHFLPQADTSCAHVTHVVRRWWRLGDCRLINSTQMHTDKGLHPLSYTTSLFHLE